MAVVHHESVDEPANDMVSMREVVVDRRDGGDLGSSLGIGLRGRRLLQLRQEKKPERIPSPAKPAVAPVISRNRRRVDLEVMRGTPIPSCGQGCSMNLTPHRSSQNRRAIWSGHALPGRKPDLDTG